MALNRGANSAVAFLPTLLSNLLPLIGVFLFDWRFIEVFAVYWVEIAVMFVVYGLAALFAERPIVLDDRDVYLPGVGRNTERHEKWDREPTPMRLPDGLPPVYPRNIRLVAKSLVWGFGMLTVATLPSPILRIVLSSGPVLATAGAMTLSRLYDLRRTFFGDRRYEEWSVHQVLEIPGRLLIFAACYLGGVVLIGGGTVIFLSFIAYDAVGYTVPDGTYGLLFGVAMVVGKVPVEWSRFQAEHEAHPSGFAAWFRPENPRK